MKLKLLSAAIVLALSAPVMAAQCTADVAEVGAVAGDRKSVV